MSGIKYYALDENEEIPYEFVVIRNVNGEPEFCASFVNTNSLAYGNSALLTLHHRNDELRDENAKLRRENAELRDGIKQLLIKRQHTETENAKSRKLVQLILAFHNNPAYKYLDIKAVEAREKEFVEQARELGVEVD